MCMLKREDPVPLYLSVMDDIRRKIQDNVYPAGHPLPSEAELAKIYSISRITVRRAISELSEEKILRKIQGKGTFALEAPIQEEIVNLGGYSETFRKRDMETSNQILEVSIVDPNNLVQERMQIDEKTPVLKIKRLHVVNDRPFAIDTSYFVHKYFSNLPNLLTDKSSLYTILEEEFETIPKHAERFINAKMITPSERKLLTCGNEPVFQIEKIVKDAAKNVIHYSQLVTPSSLATYHIIY